MSRSAVSVLLLFVCGLIPAYGASGKAGELHGRYISATTEMQRMQVAVDAINANLICRGCKVDLLDEIFSTDFRRKDPNSLGFDDKYTEVVYFDPPKDLMDRNGSAERALAYKGWYLAIKYDKDGKLVDYFLTNIHK